MKRLTLLCSLFLIYNTITGQSPAISWTSYYAGYATICDRVIYEPNCDCIYVAGYTADTSEVATPGSHKAHIGSLTLPVFPLHHQSDNFLARFDLNGNLVWSTYFGGNRLEALPDLYADPSGNIYISSFTNSNTGITTSGSLYSTKPSEANNIPYLAKFNPDGALQWSTYYDIYCVYDTLTVEYSKITADNFNNVYLSHRTGSPTEISTPGAYQEILSGGTDAYVAKFDNSGNRLWSSYYGGPGEETGLANMGKDGYLYVFGVTSSTTAIATPGTYQPVMPAGGYALFLLKLNPTDGSRIWGTYIENPGVTIYARLGVEADTFGNVYVCGSTESATGIATSGTHQTAIGGSNDLFVMKFNNTGNKVWGTYYGGEGEDHFTSSLASGATPVDPNFELSEDGMNIYISGLTNSSTGIANACGYEPLTPNRRGFISKFDTSGNMIYGSYYDAEIHHIALNNNKNGEREIYFVSRTAIDGLATPGSHKATKSTPASGLIGKFIETCPLRYVGIEYGSSLLQTDSDFENYTWYHNGTEVSSGGSSTYDPGTDTTGYYIVTAEKCGCTYTSDTFYFTPASAGDLKTQKNTLKVYPNPAESELNIVIDAANPEVIRLIEIYDIVGKRLEQNIIPRNSPAGYTIDISSITSGIYSVRLHTEEHDYTIRFVKR